MYIVSTWPGLSSIVCGCHGALPCRDFPFFQSHHGLLIFCAFDLGSFGVWLHTHQWAPWEQCPSSIGVDGDCSLWLILGWSPEFLSQIPIHVAVENRKILEQETHQQILSRCYQKKWNLREQTELIGLGILSLNGCLKQWKQRYMGEGDKVWIPVREIPETSWLPRLAQLVSYGFKWEALPQYVRWSVITKGNWCQPLASTCIGTHVHLHMWACTHICTAYSDRQNIKITILINNTKEILSRKQGHPVGL